MGIEIEDARVYKPSKAGRRFFTRKAAERAEARAILDEVMPNYRSELNEYGRPITSPEGWRYGLIDEEIDCLVDLVVKEIILSDQEPEDIYTKVESLQRKAQGY